MTPTHRYILRAALAALTAGLGALIAVDTIDTQAVVQAIYIALGAAAVYAGVGAGTPLEPKIGVKAKAAPAAPPAK